MIRLLFLVLLLTSCSWAPRNCSYRNTYAYLKNKVKTPSVKEEVPYSLFVLVNARHLDYSSGKALLKTMVKHPSDGGMNGDVGHAWVILQGEGNVIQGGHTGEFGLSEPKYLDGIMDLVESGDENPIRYLWRPLHDGRFEEGNGGHIPSYAIRISLSQEEYQRLRSKILHYDFTRYSLQNRQCVTFIEELLLEIGIEVSTKIEVPIPSHVMLRKWKVPMYADKRYSIATFHSPDLLEEQLMALVREGKGEYALDWVHEHFSFNSPGLCWKEFPFRATRLLIVQ